MKDKWLDEIMLRCMGDEGWNGSIEANVYKKAKRQILTHYKDYKSPEEVEKIIIEARIDELKHLTEWKISDSGDNDYDILFARHKRSYDDRLRELQFKKEFKQ